MKGFKTLLIWPLVFGLWSLFESAIRIHYFHDSWDVSSSFSFLALNLICSAIIGLMPGILHGLLLLATTVTGKWRDKLSRVLLPALPLAFATLLTILIFLHYNQIRAHFKLADVPTIIILVLIVGAAYAATRIVSPVEGENPSPRWRAIILLLLLTPPAFIFASQAYRNSRFNEKHPNGPISHVVFISIDTLRFDYVGAYGATQVQTPVLDKIASEGALFQVAISSIPQTGPSHISMFTGQSPLSHGVHYNGQMLPRESWTMTRQLREAGFQTGAFIAGLPLKAGNCGLDRGFQRYSDQLAPIDFFSENLFGPMLTPYFSHGYLRVAPRVTDPALRWLQQNANDPFFLFLHYYDVHYPYGEKAKEEFVSDPFLIQAKRRDVDKEKRLYAGEVHTVDSQVGRVIDLLKRSGIYDSTLLIVTADHGESLGEHDYYYDHDQYVYEQLVRVPLMIRCPALVRAGTVVREQVAILDICKTILRAVGLEPQNRTGGYSLIQLAREIPEGYEKRVILSHSFYFKNHGLRTNQWKLIHNGRTWELYDILADPAETVDLAAIQKEKAMELRQQMSELFGSAKTEKWNTNDLSHEQLEDLKSLGYFN